MRLTVAECGSFWLRYVIARATPALHSSKDGESQAPAVDMEASGCQEDAKI